MNRSEILNKLQAHKQTLAERFGVTGLALFGSYARDQASDGSGSDVDILRRAASGPSVSRYLGGAAAYFGRAVLHGE